MSVSITVVRRTHQSSIVKLEMIHLFLFLKSLEYLCQKLLVMLMFQFLFASTWYLFELLWDFGGYFKRHIFKPSIISLLFSVVISEELTSLFFSLVLSLNLKTFLLNIRQKSFSKNGKPTEFKCKPSWCECLWIILLSVI